MPRSTQRGSAILEFALVAIPVIYLTISVIELSLESWKFHSMAYAIEMAARYACAHGRTCSKNGNTCTIKVKDVANAISAQAPVLDSSLLDISLITNSATTTCNPLNTCFTNSTQFPSSSDNGVGLDIKITATYPMYNPLSILWLGTSGSSGSYFTLGASTRQTILY